MNPATKQPYFLNSGKISFPVTPATQPPPAPSSDLSHNASEKTPTFSPFDISLQEMQRRGIVNEKGMFIQKKIPRSLPLISPSNQEKFSKLFTSIYSVPTKDKAHLFPLNIAALIQSALPGLYPSVALAGGGVFSFLDIEYIKSAFDLVDPKLFDSLPKECYAPFGAEPNDYDFRINPNQQLKKNDLYAIKANVLQVFYNCFNTLPLNQQNWDQTETYVSNNCFKNLGVTFDKENQFSIVSFSGDTIEVDLMFFQKLDMDFLFRHNSMKLALGLNDFGYFVGLVA